MILETYDASQMCKAQYDEGIVYEMRENGSWLAYDAHGAIATAPTWRELYEITGHWWQ